MYELRENRKVSPKTFAHMTSNFLYEHRFGPYFVEPVVAGLSKDTYEPYICALDLIGELNKLFFSLYFVLPIFFVFRLQK